MRYGLLGVVLYTGFLFQPVAGAEPAIDPEAMKILARMTERLAAAQQLSVTFRAGYDVVQETGQKIEFGELRSLVLSRPDRLRIETKLSDGGKQLVLFDGKVLTVFNADDKVYAQLKRPGTVDEMLHYAVRDLQVRMPLARMFVTSLPSELKGRLESLAYVEDDGLTDVPTAHLAGRSKDVDFQIWIPLEGEPLPRRIVFTYKQHPGEPQFWALFSDWNLKTEISASRFSFTAPPGVEQIPFLVRKRSADDAGQTKEGKK